jgi:hypothetical protein
VFAWRDWQGLGGRVNEAARRTDQPVAALPWDLRRRGTFDDTPVLCTTEFGRARFAQSATNAVGKGHNYNQYGFSVWLADAGLGRGTAYGATDEVGWRAMKYSVNPIGVIGAGVRAGPGE